MKQFNHIVLLLVAIATFTACKKDSISNNEEIKPVTVSVKVAYDTENASYNFTTEKATVKITNTSTTTVYNAVSDANGIATFKNISPGVYNLSVSQSITAADYNSKAGTNVTDPVVYNASLSNQAFSADGQFNISLTTGRVGDFVIKQIYYAGSDTRDGALFRDQFFEVYNNSNKTLYADSLYFAQVMAVSSSAASVDLTKPYYLPSGQYDWTKAVGMSNANANTGYFYAKSLFMIPGTGKQYPLDPGKSIIIAATALNHKAPYVGVTGNAITVNKPELTVDLSGADFEVYLGDRPDVNPLASDLDVPGVTNVTVIDNGSGRDLIIDNLGRDGLVIFKTTADVKALPKYPTPDVAQVISTTKLYIQIPLSYVIDAVGLQHAVTTSRIPKRLPDAVDAGETFVPGGSYSSQSVIRKVSKTINGRIVLKDTNNSSNDFGSLLKADPSKSASSFIN